MKKFKNITIGIVLVSLLLLSACKQEPVAPTPIVSSDHTPSPVLETEPSPDAPTQQMPSPVVPEQIKADLILWVPASVGWTIVNDYDEQLQAYASQNALGYEKVDSLSPSQLGEQTRLVVALASLGEVQSMAEANGKVQFLTIASVEQSMQPNLHILSQTQPLPGQQSFLAGLALAMGTPEYRVGSITMSSTNEGNIALDGFVTGVRYFCGLCNSRYTPVIYYPITAQIENPENAQSAVDMLAQQSVKAVFVQPEISTPELISYINDKGMVIVGVEGQAGLDQAVKRMGVLSAGFVTDISPFVARILAGEQLGVVRFGLALTLIDEDLLPAGRQVLFERYQEDLLSGEIKALPYGQ